MAGGDLVRYFGNPIQVEGHVGEDLNGSGVASPGDPPVPGASVYPDFNNNGKHDETAYPSQIGPQAIPDDPTGSAVLPIDVSGFDNAGELHHRAGADCASRSVGLWSSR